MGEGPGRDVAWAAGRINSVMTLAAQKPNKQIFA